MAKRERYGVCRVSRLASNNDAWEFLEGVIDRDSGEVVASFHEDHGKARQYAREHAARLNKEVKRAKS